MPLAPYAEDEEVEDGDVELYELLFDVVVLLLMLVFCDELFIEPEALSPAEPDPLVDAPYVEFVLLLGVAAVELELL